MENKELVEILNQNINSNSFHLEMDLNWVQQLVQHRVKKKLNTSDKLTEDNFELAPPSLNGHSSHYLSLINEFKLNHYERLLLLTALVPVLRPQIFDLLLVKNDNTQKLFTEVGGMQSKSGQIFIPTVETFYFLACGENLSKRMQLYSLFNENHRIYKHSIIKLTKPSHKTPYNTQTISATHEVLEWCTNGTKYIPPFSEKFPAKQIENQFGKKDLIVPGHVNHRLEELINWCKYKTQIYSNPKYKTVLKKGYKALFYGPPGTGKSLAASIIGNETQKPVFRIDLSKVVSKYIGETEKNLATIFDKATFSDWILFFDEGDALFGSRTNTQNSNDKYANQEVSYLLQRIEEYTGMVILATNFKSNIDSAFTRRFDNIIYFPKPDTPERKKLWEYNISNTLRLSSNININTIAEKYDLTGANINNIVNTLIIMSHQSSSDTIQLEQLENSISRELAKEGKTM